jgi:predicted nucleic acid-binding protein
LIVVDASLMIGWLLREPELQAGRTVRQMLPEQTLVVPSHWPLEIANALRTNVRRKRIHPAQLEEIVSQLSFLEIIVEQASGVESVTALATFALEHGLTSYDAAYVALAMRMDAPLATLDGDMRSAAMNLQINVIPE